MEIIVKKKGMTTGMEPYIHKINYYETDKMGITHHSNYIRFMEEARVDYMERLGWGYDRLEAMGVVSPVIGASCRYRKSTTFGDELIIEVKVEKYGSIKLSLAYTMKDAGTGEICAEGRSEHCFLDKDKRPVSLKKEFPDLDAVLKQEMQ